MRPAIVEEIFSLSQLLSEVHIIGETQKLIKFIFISPVEPLHFAV